MFENGFCRSNFDSHVYNKQSRKCMIYFLLYVNDMLIACKEIEYIDKVKCMLKSKFEMKELGPTREFWAWKLKRNRKNKLLFLS